MIVCWSLLEFAVEYRRDLVRAVVTFHIRIMAVCKGKKYSYDAQMPC